MRAQQRPNRSVWFDGSSCNHYTTSQHYEGLHRLNCAEIKQDLRVLLLCHTAMSETVIAQIHSPGTSAGSY